MIHRPAIARLALVALLLPSAARGAETPTWIGYGGPEGTRVYPDANPPTRFDMTTGQGVKWETPLPVWGHGSPLAVKGKVFVLCEPGPRNLFPLILCLEAATGKVLWQKEISTPEQEKHRDALQAWAEKHYGAIQAGELPGQDKSIAALKKKAHELMGLQVDMFRSGPYRIAYSCIGEAYGTPVTDGAWVYACTTWGSYVCYALDGTVRWTTYDPQPRTFAGADDCCLIARAPILYKNLLISDVADRLRAFDRHTGKLLWSHSIEGAQDSISPPAVITVEGKDVLLTAGPNAFLLPEGKKLAIEGWKDTGMQILVKHDERDVAYFCGAGEHCAWRGKGRADVQPPAALRFSLEGDTLKAKVLWDGSTLNDPQASGGNAPWMVYDQGKFYHREGLILEALTGKTLAGKLTRNQGAVPQTKHLLCVAGRYVFGLTDKSMQVFTLDGKKVADNPVVRREPTAEQQAMHKYCTGNPRVWMEGRKTSFSYGYAFTFDTNHIYIRSLEGLICIGK